MAYSVPTYSRSIADKAARLLANDEGSPDDQDGAWDVLGNWRASHAFPLNTITIGLRQKVNRLGLSAIVVQRLKRSRSILGKLSIKPSMRLTQMQDIGGCRAVVPTIADVYSLREQFRRSRSKNELLDEDDYIAEPKESGYRGIHLVYRFQSNARPEYNKLLLEVQLRSEAQHAWATAVETVGAVVSQALKSSEGEIAWLSYFQTASLALEYLEQPDFSREMPLTKGQVARQLATLDAQLEVGKKLSAYRTVLSATNDPKVKGAGYFLLVLLPDEPGLRIFAYDKEDSEKAQAEYLRYERQLPLRSQQIPLFPELADYSGAQVVLVGADSLRSIRDAYPNYYLDTAVFMSKVEKFVQAHRRSP